MSGLAVLLVLSGAAGTGWRIYDSSVRTQPAQLLAQAYTQSRPFDLRIAGAAHSPVRPAKRGIESPFDQIPLLDAKARIAKGLASSPDSADWLVLQGRAEMLSRTTDGAISSLARALNVRPDDPAIMADFGTAYALRAQADNRVVDYSAAIEYLTRAIRVKADLPEAVFNRALVYEQMYLYPEAIREWGRYLEIDGRGEWAGEARRRRGEVERKIKVREAALAQISDDPARLPQRQAAGEQIEPEFYLSTAIVEWLPRRWDDAAAERALQILAKLFLERHGDPWLRDALAAGRGRQDAPGFAALAAGVSANSRRESEKALAAANEAEEKLSAAGNAAGTLMARAEQVYALERMRRSPDCVELALAVEGEAQARKHAWILGYMLIELGNCHGLLGEWDASYRDTARAVAMASESGYPVLRLRADSIFASIQRSLGDLLTGWDQGREGLGTFWTGPYLGIRAYQIYFNFSRTSESLARAQAAYIFGRAGADAAAEMPDRLSEATVRYRVARLAQDAAQPADAMAEYARAAKLFDQAEQTASVREMRVYAELYRAEAEISAGRASEALRRLKAMHDTLAGMEYESVQMRYHLVMGNAYWRAGLRHEAESDYRATVSLSERRLDSLKGLEQRAESLESAGEAYRGLAALSLSRDSNVIGALRVLEAFRASEWREHTNEPGFDSQWRALRRETFISYAELPDGIAMWVFDDRGVDAIRLTAPPEELKKTVERFVRLCADPASDQTMLARDGRQLYDWLVAPLAHRLEPGRVLVVETDGVLSTVPMQALLDPNSRFLGERFAIVIARGLSDYLRRSEKAPVSAKDRALVVANPTLSKEAARAFPPLPQTVREREVVATRFPRAISLVNEDATLKALLRHQPDTEVLHFSGHGFSHAGNGGLLLAPSANTELGADVLDGRLLAGQDWSRCRLAVLAACSSGIGETKGPVNPESLVRRLLWAGVARVVASRWSADSETTVRLMADFYDGLLAGHDVPEALRRATTRVREQSTTSHPYYWAGYQSFGSR